MGFIPSLIIVLCLLLSTKVGRSILSTIIAIPVIISLIYDFSTVDVSTQLIIVGIFILVFLLIRWWAVNEDKIKEEIKQDRAKRRAEYKKKKALEEKINDFQI